MKKSESPKVELYSDGARRSVTFFDTRGRLSNSPGEPAKVTYHRDGATASVLHAVDGVFHRVGGPAVEHLHPHDGAPAILEWRLRGSLSRIDGPAFSHYAPDGALRGEVWALRGISYEGPLALRSALADYDPADLLDEIRNSDYAALLPLHPDAPRRIVDALLAEILTVGGVQAVIEGAPVEWVLSFEHGDRVGL